jgi:hypothetical protein
MRALLLLALIFWSTPITAQNTRSLAPGATSPPAAIEDIAWLAGNWEGEGLGGQSFETISPSVAGQMAGHFQQVSNGALQFYELCQFVPKDGSLMMRLKHFNADLTGWEEKGVTVDFPLVAIEKDAVYFDELTMRRVGEDGLETYVMIESAGEVKEAVFRFKRAKY